MSEYYRRDGTLAAPEEVTDLWDINGRRVAKTVLADGTRVSTVHLVIDHGYGDGPPLIFETMVFPPKGSDHEWRENDMERYATEAEARAGHEAMVKKWKARLSEPNGGRKEWVSNG